MQELLTAARQALDTVTALCPDGRVDALRPGDLIALNDAFGMLRRAVDAAYLPIAAEIARQSRRELGKDSLARKSGFRSPAAMISTVTGTSTAEAVRAIAVGESTAPRLTLTGEQLPARHPYVGAALQSAAIGTIAAAAIVSMLDRVALRADPAALDRTEKTLVDAAPGLSLEHLQKLLLRAEAHLDPDGTAPRDDERRGERSLSIREDRSGMVLMTARLDPETAAPIKSSIEDLVGGMLRRRDVAAKEHDDGPRLGAADTRTTAQMRADALADICRHAIGCEQVPTGPAATVVVRMKLSDLETGTGCAVIDGIAAPVSVSTARRMAADAQIIPCVLGGKSEILDWGRTRRLFTTAQKLAAAERDGGCASCGAPPGMTAVHHVRWWARDGGRTDLANAILLCTGCHHRVHDDGWEIRIDGPGIAAKVWFIPPPWLDPSRTPRLGGRARFDIAA
jgi:5-methylcytosine-specific restriction protein A